MPIKCTVKRTQGNPLDVRGLRKKLERSQWEFAGTVSDLYLDTMQNFSDEHGGHNAYAIPVARDDKSSVLNIYVRGGWHKIYYYLDFGAMRHVRLTGKKDIGGAYSPKTQPGGHVSGAGAGGLWTNRKTGRYALLPTPVPIKARGWTKTIAKLTASGSMSYHAFMRESFRRAMKRQRSFRDG